jgi:hypothetical protein
MTRRTGELRSPPKVSNLVATLFWQEKREHALRVLGVRLVLHQRGACKLSTKANREAMVRSWPPIQRLFPCRREYVVDAPVGLADGGAPMLSLAQRRRRAVYYSAPAAAAPRSRCFPGPRQPL